MCTIKNPVCDYIFINCFISLTYMQNFIDFHHVVSEIFSFFVLKKCENKILINNVADNKSGEQ